MIRMAVCEDREETAAQLIKIIEDWGRKKGVDLLIEHYPAADPFLSSQLQYDVVFMDIEMPGTDGMSAAKQLRKKDSEIAIVFVTNISSLVIDGYSVQALDYVLKPVKRTALEMTLDNLMLRIGRKRSIRLMVKTAQGFTFLDSAEINYMESQGHRLIYHTSRGAIEEWTSLKDREGSLAEFGFARCHKSFFVNLKFVRGFSSEEVMVGGEALPIGRQYSKSFLQALTRYKAEVS